MKELPKCPRCGSTHTAAYLYGLPTMTDSIKQQLAEGSALLGGCRCSGLDPLYQCRDCGLNFGEPPQHGRYRRELIQATVGLHLHIEDETGVTDVSRRPDMMLPDAWKAFVFTLYRTLFLHNWDHKFTGNGTVDWTLTVTLDGTDDLHYAGTGAVPPYWPELLQLVCKGQI